jgi:ssRNA-specific RNase YbeY (16S rRNA maturation enzyme)
MPVFVQNLQQSVFVNIHRLLHAAEFFLSCLRLQKYEVGVACEETAVVRELNRKYRLKDIATDVLSFPQKEAGDNYSHVLVWDYMIRLIHRWSFPESYLTVNRGISAWGI